MIRLSSLFALVASFTSVVAAEEARTSKGLVVLYDFSNDSGEILDRSGHGRPLNLVIGKPDAVRRFDGKLEIRAAANIRSKGAAAKVANAVKRSGEISIEAWLKPRRKDLQGPARILTLSKSSVLRDFTLGQQDASFDVRFRSKATDANGLPSLASPSNSLSLRETHVVYTRSRSGQARMFINGRQVSDRKVGGTLDNWETGFPLAIGDEITGGRPWEGTVYLIAIYDRDLSPNEVARHHRTGINATAEDPQVVLAARRAQFFEKEIAPILSSHCLECHDSASAEGGLDLSRKTPALAGGESGLAIAPGDLDASLLWESIANDQMPQDRPPLSDEQKQVVKKWIEDDATWSVDYVDPAIYRNASQAQQWLQRLTIPEYIATVAATVGVDVEAEANEQLPVDKRADGFRNTAYNLTVDLAHVDAYANLAEFIVSRMNVLEFAKQFTKSRKLTDDNMRGLIVDMGKWVLRGPLEDHEVDVYRGISTTVASAGGNFEEAVSYILEAMLQSPKFLYRMEGQVGDGTPWPISQYELASRMSYIIWGAPPDKALIQSAEAGELADPEQIQKHISRMLDHPRAVERSRQFVSEWLNLDRLGNMQPNEEKFPKWSGEIAADMEQETIRFFEELVWKQDRPIAELLNAQFTFLSPRLAKHYGIKARDLKQSDASERSDSIDESEAELVRYELDSVPSRGGLLTHGSVLTIGGDEASMVTRGLFVLNDLLFSEVGDPPPGLDTTPVPTSPGRTHRAIATERIESVSCGGCHARFEPLAFGLEKFDGLGSFHEKDEHGNGLREDGEILFPGDAQPVAYETSAELMDLLASSDRVSQCLTRKVTQFALGRPLAASDAASIREIHQAAQKDGGTYRSLMKAIVLSDLVQQTMTERVED